MHKCRTNDRPKTRTNAQGGQPATHAQMHPYVVGGIVCASESAQVPHPAVLVRKVFSVDPLAGVWIERSGKTTRGTRPRWLDRPMLRGDEFGPPIAKHADLAKQSKGVRR